MANKISVIKASKRSSEPDVVEILTTHSSDDCDDTRGDGGGQPKSVKKRFLSRFMAENSPVHSPPPPSTKVIIPVRDNPGVFEQSYEKSSSRYTESAHSSTTSSPRISPYPDAGANTILKAMQEYNQLLHRHKFSQSISPDYSNSISPPSRASDMLGYSNLPSNIFGQGQYPFPHNPASMFPFFGQHPQISPSSMFASPYMHLSDTHHSSTPPQLIPSTYHPFNGILQLQQQQQQQKEQRRDNDGLNVSSQVLTSNSDDKHVLKQKQSNHHSVPPWLVHSNLPGNFPQDIPPQSMLNTSAVQSSDGNAGKISSKTYIPPRVSNSQADLVAQKVSQFHIDSRHLPPEVSQQQQQYQHTTKRLTPIVVPSIDPLLSNTTITIEQAPDLDPIKAVHIPVRNDDIDDFSQNRSPTANKHLKVLEQHNYNSLINLADKNCQTCQRNFESEYDYRIHLKYFHNNNPHVVVCRICDGFTANTLEKFKEHCNKSHRSYQEYLKMFDFTAAPNPKKIRNSTK